MCLGQQTKSQLSSSEKYNSWMPRNPMNALPARSLQHGLGVQLGDRADLRRNCSVCRLHRGECQDTPIVTAMVSGQLRAARAHLEGTHLHFSDKP